MGTVVLPRAARDGRGRAARRCTSRGGEPLLPPDSAAHVEARLDGAARAARGRRWRGAQPSSSAPSRCAPALEGKLDGEAFDGAVRPRRAARPRARGATRAATTCGCRSSACAGSRSSRPEHRLELLWVPAQLEDARGARRTSTCRRSTTARTRRATARLRSGQMTDWRESRRRLHPRSRPEGAARSTRRRASARSALLELRTLELAPAPSEAQRGSAEARRLLRPGVLDRLMAAPGRRARAASPETVIRVPSSRARSRATSTGCSTPSGGCRGPRGAARGEDARSSTTACPTCRPILWREPARRDRASRALIEETIRCFEPRLRERERSRADDPVAGQRRRRLPAALPHRRHALQVEPVARAGVVRHRGRLRRAAGSRCGETLDGRATSCSTTTSASSTFIRKLSVDFAEQVSRGRRAAPARAPPAATIRTSSG